MSDPLNEYLDGAGNGGLWSFSGPAMLRDLGLQPDLWQVQVMEGQFHRALLNCCRQSGKSTVTAALALHHALFSPPAKPSLTLLLSPSLRQSGELFRKVTTMYDQLGKPQASIKENMHELELANKSRIVSLPSAESTIRGYSAPSLVIVDEAARVDNDIYKAIRPMLAISHGRLLLLSTPFGKRGFFFDEWFGQGEWTRIRITAADCPRITQGFLADERRALGESWFKQEYQCSFEQMAGLVYPEYEQCICDPCEFQPAQVIAGADFGWHNPSAFLVGVMSRDDVLHIVAEVYGSYMTDEELSLQADKLCRHWGVTRAWCDSANPQSIEKMKRGGVPACEAHKAVLDGIRAVGARMRTGRLKVWRACTNLIHELGLYHYDPERKIAVDEPVKEFDHSADALRYMVMGVDRGKPPHTYQEPAQKPEPREMLAVDYGPDGDYRKRADPPCQQCEGTGVQPGTFNQPCLLCAGTGNANSRKRIKLSGDWEDSDEARRLQAEHLWENGACWETMR